MWKIFACHPLSFVYSRVFMTAVISSTSMYIHMFQHSAKSLFGLWLFLLRWPHTPQAFLETSSPSRPLLLERTGQPQHQGLHRIVCGFFNVPQGTYEHRRYLWDGAYGPYPRSLESLSICRWNYKGSTFSSVLLRSRVLIQPGFEPATLSHSSPMLNHLSHRCAVLLNIPESGLFTDFVKVAQMSFNTWKKRSH